jgi:hypothetical protein
VNDFKVPSPSGGFASRLTTSPGSLEAITHELAMRATILDLQVHVLPEGARDQIVVGAAAHIRSVA